jgi:hypothetical protein
MMCAFVSISYSAMDPTSTSTGFVRGMCRNSPILCFFPANGKGRARHFGGAEKEAIIQPENGENRNPNV